MSIVRSRDDAVIGSLLRTTSRIFDRGNETKAAENLYDTHLKRVIDIAMVLILAPVALPLMLVCMALVKATSRGAVLYSQVRVGRYGRQFRMYKIRSMRVDAESGTGPRWCTPGDSRITPVGWFLRKSHIDELPQLWNILRGELSLIGPRPERPEITTDLVRSLPAFIDRVEVRPGLSGLAQVLQPPDTSIHTVRRKLYYDLQYSTEVGPWLDARILFATGFHLVGVPARLIAWLFGFPPIPEASEGPLENAVQSSEQSAPESSSEFEAIAPPFARDSRMLSEARS